MKRILSLLLVLGCIFQYSQAQTTIQKQGKSWQLLVDGKPFDIKGVTFGYDKDIANYDTYFKDLNFLGVNAIRTWATGNNMPQLLEAAKKYNIKVMVGIWMRHGRPGMEDDDSFNYLKDKKGMEDMYNNAIRVVQKYKDHSAVLTWGIGNEVYLNMATDEEKEAYSELLERICSKIKSIDPNHPITSVEAWTFGLEWWQKYVPSIDIYGLNSYGAGAGFLASELEKRNIDKPYIVTEFGVTGEWDIKIEKYGVKQEPTDKEKYNAIANGYPEWIANKPANLGVFVFHYSDGNHYGSPWLHTHHRGAYRPQYWAIREAYTGEKPINNVPAVVNFELPYGKYKSYSWVPVTLNVADVENETLNISFHYNHREGSRIRRNQINTLMHRGTLKSSFEIQLPKEHGAIKVYVNAKDSYNNVGIASTAIKVTDEDAKNRKYLVPKVRLPFYVYKDGEDMPYAPSAYMGNYEKILVDTRNTTDVHSGSAALKISYNHHYNWYGLGMVNPANDWGDILGGYDISGATKFSFWAKSSESSLRATIGFGLIGKDKAYPDTAKESREIKLGTKWKKYTIKLKKQDLSCIRSGFTLFSQSYGAGHHIYIDDIVFE
ncbi:glycoside hydrolase family 2 TIM barrel-domain containing protein [uncultured Algibacter sp.]|uniref:glycoside hydrolase family 2 TIM barrel-domain containing protein n=1 Tax=uncultured Algibacter sp. TaxID=298659 RepID=UPI00261AC5EE|nr:glycoside hydrolase family 2 TIM barrel-domain containing protein [uncultured Algibacter sp.]